MKKIIILVLFLLVVGVALYLGYSYFQKEALAKQQQNLEGKPVLEIEEIRYTLGDFMSYVRQINHDGELLPPEVLSELFNQFVEDKLILYSARKQNLELTEDEKQAFLRRLVRDYPAEQNLTQSIYEDKNLLESLLVEKYKRERVKDLVVTDEEVKNYYQEHKKDFLVTERVRVSQILVKSSDLAIKLREKLKNATEEEFHQAAKDYSEAPDAYKGGVMGLFKPGDLPYDMEKVIFALEEGKVSQVFESPYGYHIFRLDKKLPPALMELEEAAPRIRNLLRAKKVKEIIDKEVEDLKETYHWRIYEENLPFKLERKTNV
ncbi:MAG: peptidyl-prolyl cis-trans isomerase [Candidatus Aminicenantes bacterium]|nr:peptidyl-prolyl cis-trans isomerase [Candidatus Aminicenantes bacterium]